MSAKQPAAPAPLSDKPYTPIPMEHVHYSNQIKAIGYDAASKTLAVSFLHSPAHIYHYPNVEPTLHAGFMAAKSKGGFFGQHIKALPFDKFLAPVRRRAAAASAYASA